MKNGKKRSLICILMIACMLSALTGCTTFDNFRNAFLEESTENNMPVITIGVLEPQSGNNAVNGKDEIRGIELANSIYSNVDGYKIVLSKVDTKSNVNTTRTAVQGLLDMHPVAIIGSTGEAASLAASEYIEAAKVPTITPSATNPLITQTNDYYFRACITESQMGEGLAEYAYRELGSRGIGIISLKNDSSTASVIDGFEDKIKHLAKRKSNAITATTEIASTSEEDMKAALESIREVNCDVCFVSLGTEAMDSFFTLAESMGLKNVTFLGTRSWGKSDFVSMMEKHPDIKVVFPYVSVIDSKNTSENLTEEAQRFQIQYQNRYGSDNTPTEYAALGYDSYLLLINAIHMAKSQEGEDIRDAILGIKDLQGVTGVFSFDDKGNVVRTVNLSTIREGSVVSEYVTRSEAEAKELEELEQVTTENN